VQMPVKIARSAPRPSFGVPALLVAIHTSGQSCSRAGKARIFAIRGIPAYDSPICLLPEDVRFYDPNVPMKKKKTMKCHELPRGCTWK
jgi:hypothetical protein